MNLPDIENGIPILDSMKKQIESDYNIGIDKKYRKEFLIYLEYLTRDKVESYLKIPLEKVPRESPHYLDNENDYFTYDKKSFESLIIRKTEESRKEIFCNNNELILNFGREGMFEFFTRMYVNFEIYATCWDNVITMKDREENEDVRLVVWEFIMENQFSTKLHLKKSNVYHLKSKVLKMK